MVKNPAQDGTLLITIYCFRKYQFRNPTYQNSVNSGSLIETYIVPSGSSIGTYKDI